MQTQDNTETEILDEVQAQAMRAIMTLLETRGIPTCVKRALADALEETAKIAGINERAIWTPNPGPSLNVNSKVLWEVFENPSVREVWDIQQRPANQRDGKTTTYNLDGVELPAESERVKAEVNSILSFFEASTPDFISGAVIDVIASACGHFGIDEPTYDDDPKTGSEQTGAILTQLFSKTRMFSLREAASPDSGSDSDSRTTLALAIVEILQNEHTPYDLRDRIEDFACSATDGDITQFWSLPGSGAVMEHLLRFVALKEATN